MPNAVPNFDAFVENASLRHNINMDEYEAGGELNVSISMPAAHAILLARKVWRSWCFPYWVGKERNGQAYHLACRLIGEDNQRDMMRMLF